MADHSEGSERLESTVKPERGVLRARDVIPYGSTGNEGKVVIPKFDLSREIMAGQRQTTAEKRRQPGEKGGPQERKDGAESGGYRVERLRSQNMAADKVLADIVARDIARLCGAER